MFHSLRFPACLMSASRSRVGLALAAGVALAGCGTVEAQHQAQAQTPPQVQTQTQAPSPALAPQQAQAGVSIDSQSFAQWLQGVRAEALAQGISARTLDQVLPTIQPVPRVLELDRHQPEFTQSFWGYMGRAVSDARIAQGQEMLRRHGPLLEAVAAQYGVPARFLVAFWGLETNYGANFGGFSVVNAVATLAHDTRRPAFFRRELLDALAIIDAGHIAPAQMVGSWAGAMGHLQFMPSTFRAHAVDRDGNGRTDIWNSLPDVFASAANYLAAVGWNPNQTWGREVRLPAGFDYLHVSPSTRLTLAQWAAYGITRADGLPLPQVAGIEATLVLPAGASGPAFLVYDNFNVIMTWNRSTLYALAVGHLADRLADGPPLSVAPPASERPLSYAEVKEMQEMLNHLGFDCGTPDGLAGPVTRAALQQFQSRNGLVPDGFADFRMLAALRSAVGR